MDNNGDMLAVQVELGELSYSRVQDDGYSFLCRASFISQLQIREEEEEKEGLKMKMKKKIERRGRKKKFISELCCTCPPKKLY